MDAQTRIVKNSTYNFLILYLPPIFILLITTIIYWIACYALAIDFNSYYLTTELVWKGEDPYHGLSAKYISLDPQLSPNLNAPITFLLSLPLVWMPFPIAYLVFVVLTLILSLIAANLSIRFFLSDKVNARTRLSCILTFLASYPILLNLVTGQLGAILFFLLMIGYYGYRHNKMTLTAITWGLAISMKFFAGLLIIFCLQQRQFRLTGFLIITVITLSLLPLMFFGLPLYENYIKLFQAINWYDSAWNASITGFLSRIIPCFPVKIDTQAVVKSIWLFSTIIAIIWYGFNHSLRDRQKTSFALCLVLMMVLSPLGWIYYFSILMPALLLSYESCQNQSTKVAIWIGCFFMLTFPIGHIRENIMLGCPYRFSMYAFHFYGLMLLILQLLWQPKSTSVEHAIEGHILFWSLFGILLLGLTFLFFLTQARIL